VVPDQEAIMRDLIESLSPEACQISWRWVGAMFAFYVAVMAVAASMLIAHQSAKAPMHQPPIGAAMRTHGEGM
jgi:hypothetical protein